MSELLRILIFDNIHDLKKFFNTSKFEVLQILKYTPNILHLFPSLDMMKFVIDLYDTYKPDFLFKNIDTDYKDCLEQVEQEGNLEAFKYGIAYFSKFKIDYGEWPLPSVVEEFDSRFFTLYLKSNNIPIVKHACLFFKSQKYFLCDVNLKYVFSDIIYCQDRQDRQDRQDKKEYIINFCLENYPSNFCERFFKI